MARAVFKIDDIGRQVLGPDVQHMNPASKEFDGREPRNEYEANRALNGGQDMEARQKVADKILEGSELEGVGLVD